MISDDLRKVITIEEYTNTPDGMGGFTKAWSTVTGLGSLRAAIWPISARERIENQQIEHEISHRIRCWYRSGIEPENRVKYTYGGVTRYFQIKSIINVDEEHRVIDMTCEEVDE